MITSLELTFTILFTVEMVIKMLGLGLVEREFSYFRSMWNWLDFVIVVEGLVSLAFQDSLQSNISGIRSVRALRPLRSITRMAGACGRRLTVAVQLWHGVGGARRGSRHYPC